MKKDTEIFSTNVEMNRFVHQPTLITSNFLYERGDEPAIDLTPRKFREFSLRTWR